ncbi:RluA family pseudouridine synthase [Buchnera aphidicola (Thelaxes californica)]|uniref:Pseudouridine synthase n=1 Tax=Buchnera aphidicola (Thelaxes californica) TaxID=1315998 RepID=A0A4D6YCJ0_9GAMM|nr:RluA family pseudouridine synthase [Buchnera aphidicola]QCI26802.1 RluA family pseudouridine synthase [Buchnera aphidicola (Thelaxes californica)]
MYKKFSFFTPLCATIKEKNQRIDNFLFKKFNNIPKSMIYKIIRIGKIKINEKKVTPKYKIKKGDIIYFPILKDPIKKKKITISKNLKIIEYLKKKIIYEDKYLIILNKPSGIAVHGGSGINFGVIETIRKIYPHLDSLELVHRLDRNTSGILIISKKKSVLRHLHDQIKNKTIKKCYIAFVHGRWNNNNHIISAPLIKKIIDKKKIMIVQNNGKPSMTKFQIKKKYNDVTLMSIKPITGRTHQIRVHATYAGYPLLFDNDYGSTQLDSKIPIIEKIKKILLHAYTISFIHPILKKKMFIQATLEERFKKYINLLK